MLGTVGWFPCIISDSDIKLMTWLIQLIPCSYQPFKVEMTIFNMILPMKDLKL